ncbi:PRC-barrel domain-containing protein [Aureimonas ureilytica]|uniref:PRC-barrel domain-containing protein n=1 Tax=Aureimonas ureilytica TaxID=401562 RepID=UPI0003656B7C|nr:PRC-barrel domain-containing protein [Aureimonas ureilytica]
MVRKLLATTAIATVLATGAFAQSAAPTTTTEPAMNNQGMSTGGMTSQGSTAAAPATTDTAPVADIAYIQSLGDNQYLSDDLMDMNVYASADANAEEAGEIENLIVAADGTVKAVVIDTGAYLGDQSRTIAVPFDQVNWTMGQNNEPRAVLTASREQLTSAPAFTTPAETNAAMGTTPAGGMAAAPGAATTTAPAATGGMAANTTATGTMAPAAPQTNMAASTTQPATTGTAMASSDGYAATLGADEYLASNLVGDNVYGGATTDSDRIGEINNLIVSSDGRVDGIVIGVGGFLGIGQKDVGVPFDNVSMTRGENNEPHAMLAASRDQLKNAPSFEDDKANEMAANTTATNNGMANNRAATGMAAGTAAGTAGMAAGTAAGTAGMAAGTAAGTAGMAAGTASTGMATDTTDATSTASTGGTQPMAGGSPVTGAELSADNLMGTTVYGPDNQTIGSIGDLALTPQGQVDAVIVDVGGFLGIGAKPVAVAMDNLQFMRDSSGRLTLTTQFTQDQLRNAPEYNRDSYAQNRDSMRVENPGDLPATTQAQ